MNCYRDMTFCSGDGCAKFDACRRALTDAVKSGAEAFGLPIAQFEAPRELACWSDEKPAQEEGGLF